MGLLVFLRDNPRLHTIQYHVIHYDSVTKMDSFLHAKYTQDLELNRSELVEQVVELDVLSGRLCAFIDCDNQLVGFFQGELSLRVDDSLGTRLDRLLLEQTEVLEVSLFVDEVVLQTSDRTFHIQDSFLLALHTDSTDGEEVTENRFRCDYSQLIVAFLTAL